MVDVTMQSRAHANVRFRGGGFEPATRTWVAWVFFALLLAAWQAGSEARLIDPLFLPPPSAIASALKEMIWSGELAAHLSASLVRIGGGWLLGSMAGGLARGVIWASPPRPPGRPPLLLAPFPGAKSRL